MNSTKAIPDYRSYEGRNIYCRSLCFLLAKACADVLPGSSLRLRRPISKGYYCTVIKADGTPVTSSDLMATATRMRELVEADLPFVPHSIPKDDAVTLFSSLGREDVVSLLSTRSADSDGSGAITYYTLGNLPDFFPARLLPSTGPLKVWSLEPYRGGAILRVPNRHAPEELAPYVDQPKTFEVFREAEKWNSIMDLRNTGDVNLRSLGGDGAELIQVSEALQEKKIVQMAEEIFQRYYSQSKVRLVLITGPTSSGKTTVCRRLSIQLKACGLHPVSFSTDDYFVNRADTPLLPDGSYDFDNFDTVDHDALQADLLRLLSGECVEVPEYNFVTGIREYNGKRLQLSEGSVLILEGIHALNPALTEKVPQEQIYRIFINAITSISLDDHNCISTSDNRLLRRIVRDALKGAFSARETISAWPNVRRAEVKWIYPFQENADALFNSTYLVEFAVLRPHAERILATVPKDCPEYADAERLLTILSFFTPISDRDIPSTSLIRSFLGPKQ